MLWMGFVACMSLFFGGAAWNGFTLSALYCQRDELQVIRCEIGTALLGVPEWERREPLPGELLSTRIATHRGSRSTSYAIELNTPIIPSSPHCFRFARFKYSATSS